MPEIRIGISGWTYPPWRGGAFYPDDLPQKRELEYASRQVSSIEINGTFYSLQKPASFESWYKATPDDFVFAVKGGRFITHIKRLNDVDEAVANFFASGILRLREKLGPILWQLPPSFRYDRAKLERFFDILPRDTESASVLAEHHDDLVAGDTSASSVRRCKLRHALEIRHPSFENPEFIELLRKHGIGLVVADTAGKWPFMEDVTADFVYIRLHGDSELYVSGYTDKALRDWAEKIRKWSRGVQPASSRRIGATAPRRKGGRDVYAYFDNDVKVRSPFDAMTLGHLMHLGPSPGVAPDISRISELPRRDWPGKWRRKPQ